MAVLGRLLVSSAERLDLPDLLSIESYVAGDFKHLLYSLVGDQKPYIIKGFEVIDPNTAIGSTSISIKVANSAVFFPNSVAGPFFYGLPEGHAGAAPISPELRTNAVNFVYATLTTVDAAQDTRAFWDPDKDGGVGGEFTQDVNTESVLKVQIGVSVSSFPDNCVPIAKVAVGASVVQSIEDCRDMMYRLASGGLTPDSFSKYNWRPEPEASHRRTETPSYISSPSGLNPFSGADKNIHSLKEWMDAVMTKINELGGTRFWYEDVSSYNLVSMFDMVAGSTVTSKGEWRHSSATAGRLDWNEDLKLKFVLDPRELVIKSGSKSLSNNEVLYVNIHREKPINGFSAKAIWINGESYVNGIVGAFENLAKGDWVKVKSQDNSSYVRVEEFWSNSDASGSRTIPSAARSIKVSRSFQGVSDSYPTVFTKGSYNSSSEVLISERGSSAINQAGADLYWLAHRSDTTMSIDKVDVYSVTGTVQGDGSKAKFAASSPHGLLDGDRICIIGSSAYDGEFEVETEDDNTFYIETTETSTEQVTAYIAIVTTGQTITEAGLVEESNSHGFNSNETITVSGVSQQINGEYVVNQRSETEFSIPIRLASASSYTWSSGPRATAVRPRISVRTEEGVTRVIRGETRVIGSIETSNVMDFIGMRSTTQRHPEYRVSNGHNMLDGMQNFNTEPSDTLTHRTSKLTSMMADRVQDRGLKISGVVSISNKTAGINQAITATDTVTLIKPGSPSQSLNLTCNLPQNHAAVASIDRNGGASLSLVSVSIFDRAIIDENKIVVFYRLTGSTVFNWQDEAIINNATLTIGLEETSQNRNVAVFSKGEIKFESSTGVVRFMDEDADIRIVIPGSLSDNTVDVSELNTYPLTMPNNSAAWVRINRNSHKVFNTIQTSDVPDTNTDGAIFVTNLTGVPKDQDVFILFVREGENLSQLHLSQPLPENVYEEILEIVESSPQPGQILGPIQVGDDVSLPLDSRDLDRNQFYIVGAGHLEVYLNGQLLNSKTDYTEVGTRGEVSSSIQMKQQLVDGDVLLFRIDAQGSVYFAATGGMVANSTLQSAYNTGNSISTTAGNPVTISGPTGSKLFWVQGDVQIDGVIDPTGITFIPQPTSPFAEGEYGLFIDSKGDLIQQKPEGNIFVNITETAQGTGAARSLKDVFHNATGSTIARAMPVSLDYNGELTSTDVSTEQSALSTVGITSSNISNLENGEIVVQGRLENIVTSASLGDVLYVSKTGQLTNIKPTAGSSGFAAGDWVVRIGVIAKNAVDPTLKDVIVNVQVIGQL